MAKKMKVDTSDIPEVAAFEEAKLKLQRMKAAYPEVFEAFEPLVEDYNDKLEAAEKAVKSRGVDCGDFTKLSETVKWDTDQLYERLGHKKFLTIGTITTKQVLDVDKKKLEMAIVNNSIDGDEISDLKKVSPSYKKPKPVVMP